jgi:hypothetical protein
MRRQGLRVWAAVSLIALCVAVAPVEGTISEPRRCVVYYRCRTLLANRKVRIFQETPRPPREPINYLKTFALWRRTGRLTPLGDRVEEESREPELRRMTLSGQYLAYTLVGSAAFRNESSEGLTWQIRRLNIRTGRSEKVRREYKCVAADQSEDWDAPGVTDLLVTPNGTMAWIFGSYYEFPTNYRVCELPPGTPSPILLANSQTITPKSLAIASNRLSWRENGIPRSAPLPHTSRPQHQTS